MDESDESLITNVVLHCPKCGELSTPDPTFHGKCPFCGYRWEDDIGHDMEDPCT